MEYQEIYQFWFVECQEQDWWQKSAQFDNKITTRFAQLHEQAMAGELAEWRKTAVGALCEIIVLDQFSRNMFRDTPAAFASDPLALCLAQHAIEKGFDQQLEKTQRTFMYLPFMHSESLKVHQQADALFKSLPNYEFELAHKKIIEQFGRYPHRNAILGRESSPEELAFLQTPGSSF
ncbi:DUF924 domain-containing protein [Pseudoalteromonas sp. DL2-H2.2]|uniref:DUF924 family protein n=1 Tax=Pseudoalteromonas sp. DL2-H2.2 TaxID=2908889 RepID=UPI001F47B109|nr:DUF924 family protein [Pseudoalteromonas sp. DL2-H2.2]MCF2908233.1 DUF924 domain-containing protein [Pseudoalteromonas sp. DL2-H2.2]